jgi:hypothetical protein
MEYLQDESLFNNPVITYDILVDAINHNKGSIVDTVD